MNIILLTGIIITILSSTILPTFLSADAQQFHFGIVAWAKSNYQIDEIARVGVRDPDMNLNSDRVDFLTIGIDSDSDSKGLTLRLIETGSSTGIFVGVIQFGSESSENQLGVSEGDKIYARYIDSTLPSPYSPNDVLKIVDTTSIGDSSSYATTLETKSLVVRTDKQSYVKGETIVISGEVDKLFSYAPVALNLYGPDGRLLVSKYVGLTQDKKYSAQIKGYNPESVNEGTYLLKVTYGPEVWEASTSFSLVLSSIVLPDWIRNVAAFWCNEQIEDSSFIGAIQYLIKQGIIMVPTTKTGAGTLQEVPPWIKNNACWWSEGLISDEEFAQGIQFLISKGIIKV